MIEKMEIAGVHMDVEPKLQKYVTKKMGAMDKYIPRHARESAHLEVKLKEEKAKDKNQYTCEVILYLPHDSITIHETTMNIFAAVDIVETKLKNQIRKYKQTHTTKRIPGKIAAKIRSRRSA
jgi:ribosomal subunit interface protein